jgi:hypothetical protein
MAGFVEFAARVEAEEQYIEHWQSFKERCIRRSLCRVACNMKVDHL